VIPTQAEIATGGRRGLRASSQGDYCQTTDNIFREAAPADVRLEVQSPEQIAAMAEQSTAASQALSNGAHELGRLVRRFRLAEGQGAKVSARLAA